MLKIRFSGIVRLANSIQRELSGPVSAQRIEFLRVRVSKTVELVENTLRKHGTSLHAIPGPTRRAFDFLRTIQFDRVSFATDGPARTPGQRLVIRGLIGRVEWIAEDIARRAKQPGETCEESFVRIRRMLAGIDSTKEQSSAHLEHLTNRNREHLAWLKFLSDQDNFVDYLEALRRATAIFDSLANQEQWPRPIVVHFRPTHSVYRVRVAEGRTRALLPTPMISLDEAGFAELGRAMFGRKNRKRSAAVHAILLSEPYQELQAELEALGGVVEESRGMIHDLSQSFDRVNATYFAGQMPRPHLTWNRSITAGKFGHYNYSSDTVMISRSLDRLQVPDFVVDHVMHHELLHKKHGLRWHQGRGHAHTADFRNEERQFARYVEADQFLRRLATGGSTIG